MVELELVQTLSYVVAALSFAVTCTYYIMNLKNTERIRKRDMVFQRLNINMIEHYRILYEVLNMKWDTMEELNDKYGLRTNPEAFAKRVYVINHFNCLGLLMKEGIVDADEVFQLNPPNSAHGIYTMYEPWIITQRMDRSGKPTYPDNYKGFEYLYHEVVKRYPNMIPLREWSNQDPKRNAALYELNWDEYFMKNPQLLENPLPAMKKK